MAQPEAIIESHTLKVFGAMNADDNRKTAIKIIKTIRDDPRHSLLTTLV